MKLFCDRPDVHLPRMKCNRPLPCKFHGGRRGRMASFEDFAGINRRHYANRSNGLPLVAPRIFDIRIGQRWIDVCQMYLHQPITK